MTGRDRIRYTGHMPQPLGIINTAERLAIVEAMGALGRELTADESKAVLAAAHLFCGQIVDLEWQLGHLAAKLMEIHRETG